MRPFLLGSALLAALAVALVSAPGRAADSDTIDKLVKQLGSGRYQEREKAQKKLAEIGPPAVAALKKAAESGDAETQRRANELLANLDKQTQRQKVLAPTRIKLSFKDTPLKEALADLTKKTGYQFSLVDPEGKLKDRKVTLEVAETSFWEAFDQFCGKAGLAEADTNEANPYAQPVFEQGGIRIIPNVAPPAPAPAPAPRRGAAPAPRLPQALAAQVAAQRIRALRPYNPRYTPPVNPTITLKDGTEKDTPTSYAGAVRIRATNNVQQFGTPGPKEILLGLKVSPEPKLRWQKTVNVRVEKALDDQGQSLLPKMADNTTPNPGDFDQIGGFPGGGRLIIRGGGIVPLTPPGYPTSGGLHQYAPVRLAKGEKPSKVLKELTGVLTAEVLAEAEVHITADNILKAADKTFKGKDGGSIKVLSVTENGDMVTLKLEFDAPKDVVPAQPAPVAVPGGIQVLPAPAPPPPPRGAFQVQVQQIQIVGGGVVYGGNSGAQGLELLDEKGNAIACVGTSSEFQGNAGNFKLTQTMSFRAQKDQKASKLVFKGSKSVGIDIPFSLKDVKLP